MVKAFFLANLGKSNYKSTTRMYRTFLPLSLSSVSSGLCSSHSFFSSTSKFHYFFFFFFFSSSQLLPRSVVLTQCRVGRGLNLCVATSPPSLLRRAAVRPRAAVLGRRSTEGSQGRAKTEALSRPKTLQGIKLQSALLRTLTRNLLII